MKKILLKIITPEKTVFEEEVYQVTMPTSEGEVTILPDHIPYIASLKAGEIVLKKSHENAEEVSLAVSGGFAELHGNVLRVLADTAERADEIDLARAEEARKRAEELREKSAHLDSEEYAQTAAILEKELSRVRVARKHHTKKGFHVD